MKTLIAYYSFTQNNEKLAKYLQEKLHGDIVKLETLKKRTGVSILLDLMFGRKPEIKPVPYSLRDYDHLVLLGPIWAGRLATPLKTFISNEKRNIIHYSFVTLCGGGSPDQKSKIKKELLNLVGKAPDHVLELWINNLLPEEKRNTIKYTSGYRIEPREFSKFETQINELLTSAGLVSRTAMEPVV